MSITKKILLLTLFQGLVCQRWEFPSKIDGLVGSCVEIPCTFRPRENPGTSSTVWYLYQRRGYPQIFNSQENSSVLMDYKDRTSLVPGNNSCSLIIDPVRREDGNKYYYPGIAGDEYTNAYSQRSMYLQLHVTDDPTIPELTGNKEMLEGHSETFQCSVEHTCGSNPPSLKWNKDGQTERRSEDLSGGKWREILTITYIPSHEDDKTQMKCTATYHNGEKSYKATTLNIKYSKANLILILGIVAGVILLILIVYIVTRNKVCQTSIRHENSQLDNTYMILMKTETSFPAQPEPGGRDSTSGNLYETLQTKK